MSDKIKAVTAIHPHSGSSDGGYVKCMSDDDHRATENYGANHERLSGMKAVYDPENRFRVNQNIAEKNGR